MTDSELIAAVRSGDRNAYGTLVERHQSAILGRCRQVVGNAVDAEELAHQAFVEGYIKLDQLREPDKFLAWMRRISLNLCRMWFRDRKRASVDLFEPEWLDNIPGEETPDYRLLAAGLKRLSPPHRMILVLRYFEKLSYEDVAAFLEIPVGTVMSRLHRAHASLRKILDEMDIDDEMETIMTPEQFRNDVEIEIEVLLDMFSEDPTTMERLSLVLGRAPERLMQLIKNADDRTLDHVACLLPHLGREALHTVISGSLSHNTEEQRRNRELLRKSMVVHSIRFHFSDLASINAYRFADSLIESQQSEEAKVDLLLALMETLENEADILLVTHLVLCYAKTAVPILLDRFWQGDETPDILYALCRAGKVFSQALLDPLASAEDERLRRAVTGVEALARCFDIPWTTKVSALHFANTRRTWRRKALLRRNDIDKTVLDQLIKHTIRLLRSEETVLRESALCTLGLLRADAAVSEILHCAAHSLSSTRIAALQALADIGAREGVPVLLSTLEHGESPEQITAIRALCRMNVVEAEENIEQLIEEADTEVQIAAIVALGDIGRDGTQAKLKAMLRSKSPRVKKAAAKALYAGKRKPPPPLESSLRRVEKAGRLDAQPFDYRSPDVAIRYAIPELRPYTHQELTQNMAQVSFDFSSARRFLICDGFMERSEGLYTFTDIGETVWRVEHFIMDKYLAGS